MPQYAVCVYDSQHVLIAEHAVLEQFLGELGGEAGCDLVLGKRSIPGLRDAGRREDLLGHRLVHRQSRAEHAGPGVGNVGEFEQALHGAVLAHRTVQER